MIFVYLAVKSSIFGPTKFTICSNDMYMDNNGLGWFHIGLFDDEIWHTHARNVRFFNPSGAAGLKNQEILSENINQWLNLILRKTGERVGV